MNITVILALSAAIAAGNIALRQRLEVQGCAIPSADKAQEVAVNIILSGEKNPRITYQTPSSSTTRVITERALERLLFENSKVDETKQKEDTKSKSVFDAAMKRRQSQRDGRQNSCGRRDQNGPKNTTFSRLEKPTNRSNWKKS